MAEPDDGSGAIPGGRKIVGLVVAVVGLLALLAYNPGRGGPDTGVNPLLADLGTTDTDDLLDRIGGAVGAEPSAPATSDGGDLDLPVAGGNSGGLDIPGMGSEAGGLDIPGLGIEAGGLDIPEMRTGPGSLDVPGVGTGSVPGAPGASPRPLPGLGQLRQVDAEALFAAQAAGDAATLLAVARDSSYLTPGRVLALTLASLVEDGEVSKALYEVFEGKEEPFALRESAVYALLRREAQQFPVYLTRVLDRPTVRVGQDEAMTRLIMLGFYSDRWLEGEAALDRVSAAVMGQARAGSKVALGVLSFALAPERPMDEARGLFEAAEGEPVVGANLVRFYRQMVARGQLEYEAPLANLERALGG